ncbi:MAG: site-2 protease family protein [candidate division WOR-3 bacterium]
MLDNPILFLLRAPAILFNLTIHEFAHGYIADKLGDPTARLNGRLTLNPLKHLDPIGTIAIFLFHFGWAKPVPLNPYNFRKPRRDMMLASIAGPIANLLCALVFSLLIRFFARPLHGLPASAFMKIMPSNLGEFISVISFSFFFYGLILAAFNLIPIPPLDGSKILYYLLPANLAYQYMRLERYGFFILLGIIFLGSVTGVPILWSLIQPFIAFFSFLFLGQSIL